MLEVGLDPSIPSLIRHCIGQSARHSQTRKRVFERVVGKLDGKAQDALRRYLAWLPISLQVFHSPASDDNPEITCQSYCAQLFANVDGGANTSPTMLLRCLGEEAPDYISMATNSKSGEFFYFSHDHHFLIKTISAAEANILLTMLPEYQGHLRTSPFSLLVRFAGLFRADVGGKNGQFFIVMVSTFDRSCAIHEIYDVKGSLFKRKKKPEETVGKDQDWFDCGRRLHLPPQVRLDLMAAHEADALFLLKFNVMDYSILIGIHKLEPNGPCHPPGYREGGGLHSSGSKEVFFIGIIDFLIAFTVRKAAEHLINTAKGHEGDASCTDPESYALRQVKFVRDAVFEKSDNKNGNDGMLEFKNMKCMDLLKTDLFGKSDPYMLIRLGLQETRTEVLKNNLNPIWFGTELEIPVNVCHKSLPLVLKVFDSDRVRTFQGSDDPLGYLTIDAEELFAEKVRQIMAVPLQGVKRGRITAQIEYVPNTQPEASAAGNYMQYQSVKKSLENVTAGPTSTASEDQSKGFDILDRL